MKELGCSSIVFREADIQTAIDRISAQGFKVMDLGMLSDFCSHFDPMEASDDDYRQIVNLIERSGLKVCTLNVDSGVAFNDPLRNSFQREYVRKSLKLANTLGCYALSVQAGLKVRDRNKWIEDARLVALEVERLGDLAHDLGIELTLEVPHKDTFAETFDEARDLMEMVSSEKAGITLDTSHVAVSGVSLSEAVRTFGKRIKHVHLRDAQDDNFLLTPGDGAIDFRSFFEQMSEVGYDGDYVLELEFEGMHPEQIVEELNRAREFIEPLL